MGNSIFLNEKNTERTLIESILASYYIVDYGFIKAVNPDETVNVVHAKQLKTLDGESLKATLTENVEVLTLAGAGFSFKFDYKKGDKVLLVGLKDYIKEVEDVTSATETTVYLHYSRETLKAIPMCVFNGDAKVKVEVKEGTLNIECEQDVNITAKGNCTVKSTHTKLTGGNVEVGGSVTPSGQGALCGLPYCAYSGAPQTGKISSGA
jgi:hypothetical protein